MMPALPFPDVKHEDAPAPDVVGALVPFEAWCRSTHPNALWVLFENSIPETFLVYF